MARLTSAVYLLACLGVASSSSVVASAAADSNGPSSYVIERSIDNGATWAARGTVVVTGAAVNSAKAKFVESSAQSEGEGLKEADRTALLAAESLIFRVRENSAAVADADAAVTEIARVVTTPCALIRGFDIKTRTEVELTESLNVVISKGADGAKNVVTGLQLVPRTNLHHSASKTYGNAGETCDPAVLALFPKLTVATTVGVARTVVPKRAPNFGESYYVGQPAAGAEAPPPQADPNQKVNAEGKPVDADGKVIPEPDNRSFLEKYWHYILMFVVWQLIQGFLNPQKPAEGAAAAGGAAKQGAAAPARK